MTRLALLLLTLIIPTTLFAQKPAMPPPMPTDVNVRGVRYDAKLSDNEARFIIELDFESTTRGETSLPLVEGEVAVIPPQKLPSNLWIVRERNQYRLMIGKAGQYKVRFEMVAKIKRTEPWNEITFIGPPFATIASMIAEAAGAGVEIQMLHGTTLQTEQKDGVARLRGFLGANRVVALRWQSKAAEAARKAVFTCDSAVTVQVSPTVIKYVTDFRYDILQGSISKLTIALPSAQSFTRVDGAQIRDWSVVAEKDRQVITVELIKPVEKNYALSIFSEQTVDTTPFAAQVRPPEPLEVARESGMITIFAEDTVVETELAEGMRQTNAPAGALAAYRFDGRPVNLKATLKRIQSVVNVETRVAMRLEESRLLALHRVFLTVEKAGIFSVEMTPLGAFTVADVRGDGVEDWKVRDGKLNITFRNRVLGAYRFEVHLEQRLKEFPETVSLAPLRVTGAAKETGQVGSAASAGIRLKTSEMVGLREIPVASATIRTDEMLGYAIEQPDWKLTVSAEKLPPRILADIFNLVTIGDGIVLGSATVRYQILNQGVQEFKLQVPPHWKNVDFTGPNLRRKERNGDVWTITLQDKAWGAYTLVVSYDYMFEGRQAKIGVGGIHAVGVERETGSVAITSGTGLQLNVDAPQSPLRLIDEQELAFVDRAFITRPVLHAYQYTGDAYALNVQVTRFDEQPPLQAVADLVRLVSNLSDEGEMLTQATFLVKNNERQFLEFALPQGATLWTCSLGGQPVKPERNGGKYLIPLRRDSNRDEAYPVDIVYAQTVGSLKTVMPQSIALIAPKTDMQTTYAEWELFVPATHTLFGFGGNMGVAPGSRYGWSEAWQRFTDFYTNGDMMGLGALTMGGALVFVLIIVAFIYSARKHGSRGVVAVLLVLLIIGIVAGMLLPTLGLSREKANRAFAVAPRPSVLGGDASEIQLGVGMKARELLGLNDRDEAQAQQQLQQLQQQLATQQFQLQQVQMQAVQQAQQQMVAMQQAQAALEKAQQEAMRLEAQNAKRREESRGIIDALNSIEIPEVNFREADLTAVIDMLRAETVRLDPNGKGVNIIARDIPAGRNVRSLRLRNIKLMDVLKVTADLVDMRIVIEPNAVVLVSKESSYGMQLETRTYAIDPSLGAQLFGQQQTAKFEIQGGYGEPKNDEMSKKLAELGVPLPAGANAQYIPQLGRLVVTNTPQNLEKAEKVLEELSTMRNDMQQQQQQQDAQQQQPQQQQEQQGQFSDRQKDQVKELERKYYEDRLAKAAPQPSRPMTPPGQPILAGTGSTLSATGGLFLYDSGSIVMTSMVTNSGLIQLMSTGSFTNVGTLAALGGDDSGRFMLDQHGRVIAMNGGQIAMNNLARNPAMLGIPGGVMPITAAQIPAMVSGKLPILIDVPRSGKRFVFTKSLNVDKDSSLLVKVRAVKQSVMNTTRGSLQLTAFLIGIIVIWRQLRRKYTSSFWVAIGGALILVSIGDALMAWQQLHRALILAPPALLFLGMLWLFIRWLRRRAQGNGRHPSPPEPAPVVPPTIACLGVAALIGIMFTSCGTTGGTVGVPIVGRGVSIVSTEYEGSVSDRVARIQATIHLSSAEANRKVVLFTEDIAIEEFTASSRDVHLLREGNLVSVVLPQSGSVTVKIKFLLKVQGDVDKRSFGFAIPSALTSQLSLTINESEASVEVPAAVLVKTDTPSASTQNQTRVTAVIGASDRLDVLWTPRVKRAGEIAATVFCQNTALVSVGGGVINVRATLDYSVSQGELREARVNVPDNHRILRVQGEHIRTWTMKEEGGKKYLSVELLKGVSPTYRLLVETESPLDKLPTTTKVEIPHALGVKRETGWIALSGGEELSLSVESTKELQKVDTEEFLRASNCKPTTPVTSAYRFQKPEFEMTVRAETVTPQIEAMMRARVRVDSEQLNVTTQVDYNIKRAGVFSLRWLLPPDFRIESVKGDRIAQWVEKTENGSRILEVTLHTRTQGAYSLTVVLTKSLKELPKTLAVVSPHPLDTQKLTGFVIVATEPGVQAKTVAEQLDGLSEVPAVSAGESGNVLAYKFIASEPTTRSPWKLTVETEMLEPWVRSEIMNWVTLSETLVNGRTTIRFEVTNAPTKAFRVRVPAEFKNVEIIGNNIRRRDFDKVKNEWRVELQTKVMGVHYLTVTWDRPWDAKKDVTLLLTGLDTPVPDVERENGWIAVVAPPQLEVKAKSVTDDLLYIDRNELPDWAGRASETTVLTYRYLRAGWRAAVDVKRFDEAQILQALVDSAQLRTVVAPDGQMMTSMTLKIRNNSRQFLSMTMPKNSEVWSSFVNGLPVRTSKNGDKIQIPLERDSGNQLVLVEMTYVSHEKFPAKSGGVKLVAPQLDVPLKNARWDLFLPPDYKYSKFEGSMAHEPQEVASRYRSFTVTEYAQVEAKQKLERDIALSNDLLSAQKELATGNLQGANVFYNRALDNKKDTQQLHEFGDKLRFTNANFWVVNNGSITIQSGVVGADAPPATPTNQVGGLDMEAATKQLEKLQQAQALTTTRTGPLRVNLPTRGVSHSFVQVLQTQVDRPMTIEFNANNTKTGSVPLRIAGGLAAFAALWFIAAWALRRRGER